MEMSNSNCEVCGKKSTSTCGKCKLTRYCSKECQRKDWKKHKNLCHGGPANHIHQKLYNLKSEVILGLIFDHLSREPNALKMMIDFSGTHLILKDEAFFETFKGDYRLGLLSANACQSFLLNKGDIVSGLCKKGSSYDYDPNEDFLVCVEYEEESIIRMFKKSDIKRIFNTQ